MLPKIVWILTIVYQGPPDSQLELNFPETLGLYAQHGNCNQQARAFDDEINTFDVYLKCEPYTNSDTR